MKADTPKTSTELEKLFELIKQTKDPKSLGIEIERTQLHQAVAVPKGSAESGMHKSKGVVMVWNPDGLFCSYKGLRFITPLANCVCFYVDKLN